MNSSHLLQLWLDGDLDIANEQQLFAELASDSLLREEMHDLLVLREVVAMDHSAHVPSETATRGVFERLGFTPPAAEPVGWFGKYKQGIVSSTTTAAIMLLLFLWDPIGWGSPTQQLTQPVMAELVAPQQSLPASGLEATLTTKSPLTKSDVTNAQNKRIVANEAASTPTRTRTTQEDFRESNSHLLRDNSRTNQNNEESILQPSSSGEMIASSTLSAFEVEAAHTTIGRTESQSAPVDRFVGSGSVARDRVSPVHGAAVFSDALYGGDGSELLDVRHSSSMPLISTRVDPEVNSLNGFSAIYWRARSDKFWFGLAAGQEAMYQEYGHKRDDGRIVSMAQYPSVFWYGAAARYYFNSTIAETPLYSEMILAANRFGPMSKLSVGAQWSPYSNLTLQAGIDGQLSFYNHQQRLYTTPSLGLSYGIVFKF